jgi:hypothetical protein
MISSLVWLSRLPVGSSARISCGELTSARAIATRCCWPPEMRLGSDAGIIAEADPAQLAPRPCPPRLALEAGVDQRQGDVVFERHARQQVEALEDEADGAVAQRRQFVLAKCATLRPTRK